MLKSRPNFILVVIEFKYDSKDGTKYYTNDIREAFLGKRKGHPKIPKKMKEEMNKITGSEDEIIFPIYFALIKKPIKIEMPELGEDKQKRKKYNLRNTAVGAMILYEYRGLFQHLGKFLIEFNKFLNDLFEEKKHKYLFACKNYKIIIGKDLENVKI